MKELRARYADERDKAQGRADADAARAAEIAESIGAKHGGLPPHLRPAAARAQAFDSRAQRRRHRIAELDERIADIDALLCICGHRCADHDDFDGPCTLVDDCKGCPAFVLSDGTSRDRSDDIRIAIFRLNTERARAHPKALPDALAHVLRVVGTDETVTVDDIRTETAEGVRYLRLRDDITVGAKLSHTEAPSGLRGVV